VAFPATIAHNGAIQGSPAASSSGIPSLLEILNTSFLGTYGASKGARVGIIGATTMSPYVIPLETIVRVRVFGMRVRGGTMTVNVDSPVGAAQLFPASDITLMHLPFSGSELTAIRLIGTADVEYIIAGDTN
jgi:hypothetical protein